MRRQPVADRYTCVKATQSPRATSRGTRQSPVGIREISRGSCACQSLAPGSRIRWTCLSSAHQGAHSCDGPAVRTAWRCRLMRTGDWRMVPPRIRPSCADESVCKPGPVQGSVTGLPCATIPLRLPLPTASSGLPVNSGGPPSNVHAGPTRTPVPLDLAPGGVCIATPVTWGAGGLLHHRFTLTPRPKARGGLLSVALSRGSPRVGVTHHPALRSPDFPRRRRSVDRAAAVARPTHPRPQRSGGPDPRRPRRPAPPPAARLPNRPDLHGWWD